MDRAMFEQYIEKQFGNKIPKWQKDFLIKMFELHNKNDDKSTAEN